MGPSGSSPFYCDEDCRGGGYCAYAGMDVGISPGLIFASYLIIMTLGPQNLNIKIVSVPCARLIHPLRVSFRQCCLPHFH